MVSGPQGGAVSAPRATVSVAGAWQVGLAGVVTATVANILVWLVVQKGFDAGLLIPKTIGSTELRAANAFDVALNTVVPGILGVVLLWLFTRSERLGVRWWAAVLVVLTILSCALPLMLDESAGRKLALAVFHVVALVVFLGTVRYLLGRRSA